MLRSGPKASEQMNGKSPHAPSDRQFGWWGVKASEAASSLALGHLEVLIKCLPPAYRVVTSVQWRRQGYFHNIWSLLTGCFPGSMLTYNNQASEDLFKSVQYPVQRQCLNTCL